MDEDRFSCLMSDIDPELVEFLRTKVNSFVKWDLIHFFHDHPHVTETAENVARYVRWDTDAIRVELSDLVDQKVLVRRQEDEWTAYSLTEKAAVSDLVHRFVEASSDPQFRVKAVYQVIRSMRLS